MTGNSVKKIFFFELNVHVCIVKTYIWYVLLTLKPSIYFFRLEHHGLLGSKFLHIPATSA